MDKRVKIYDLNDPQQYEDEKEYWKSKSPEEKLQALEAIRATYLKLNHEFDGDKPRFRRVFQIVERK
jgi:hypothetical protein